MDSGALVVPFAVTTRVGLSLGGVAVTACLVQGVLADHFAPRGLGDLGPSSWASIEVRQSGLACRSFQLPGYLHYRGALAAK